MPKGTEINVQYNFTPEGRLQVKAQTPRSGQALPISVRREHGLSDSQLTDWKNLLARGGGLKAVLALLPKHQQERETQAAAEAAAAPTTAAQPPPLPTQAATHAQEPQEFAVEAGTDLAAARRKRRQMTPRKLAIMIGGYLVSAILGTAIGYYILMRIDPSYNWWHLRLPGLRNAPASGALTPGDSDTSPHGRTPSRTT